MIPRETVDEIINTARIEDVIGEYLTLKKRGVNMIGNCPFHNEKTPSFTVSPVKGIYKCFGCGKAGNSVSFIMEHDKLSYVEALKVLAKKYNIVIEEEAAPSDEALEAAGERESLLIVLNFAAKFYTDLLMNDEEGKTVGLSYFKERGFREDTIEKFGLGFSKAQWSMFTDAAINAGYKMEYLQKAGLSKVNEQGKHFDLFRDRVIFPIHNIAGKVIAFAGRQLKKEEKSPKYINSPETDVYHKSEVLYGLYFARQAIRTNDNCYLVEGYTDVITLYQAGVQNVVASSGTSLTEQQVKALSRFSPNVTILYDGDAAGMKASLRGIDMLLTAGLNVKVVVFPEGEDPDSYCKSLGGAAFKEYIEKNAKDFILYKSELLLKESENDPIKKSNAVKDIVESISKINDAISRSFFIKECSMRMGVPEQLLITELNKFLRQGGKGYSSPAEQNAPKQEEEAEVIQARNSEEQEKAIIRLLMTSGNQEFEEGLTVGQYLARELEMDEIELETPLYRKVMEDYIVRIREQQTSDEAYYVNHPDPEISHLAANLLTSNYHLSVNWHKKHEIMVGLPENNYKKDANSILYYLRLKKIEMAIEEHSRELRESSEGEKQLECMMILKHLQDMREKLTKAPGTVVIR
jgi:DNA primase